MCPHHGTHTGAAGRTLSPPRQSSTPCLIPAAYPAEGTACEQQPHATTAATAQAVATSHTKALERSRGCLLVRIVSWPNPACSRKAQRVLRAAPCCRRDEALTSRAPACPCTQHASPCMAVGTIHIDPTQLHAMTTDPAEHLDPERPDHMYRRSAHQSAEASRPPEPSTAWALPELRPHPAKLALLSKHCYASWRSAFLAVPDTASNTWLPAVAGSAADASSPGAPCRLWSQLHLPHAAGTWGLLGRAGKWASATLG